MCYLNLGILLFKSLDRRAEALTVFDAMAARFRHGAYPNLRDVLAKAAASRLSCINSLRSTGVDISYGEQYENVSITEMDALRDQLEQAQKLTEQDQHMQAITLCDDVLDRYATSIHPEVRVQCSYAMVRKGYCLSRLRHHEQALAVLDQHIVSYGDEQNTLIQKDVALCLFNRGVQLDRLGRTSEELTNYDETIRRYRDSDVTYLQEYVAKASYNKAFVLTQEQDTLEQGLALYRLVIRLWLTHSSPVCRLQAVTSSINLAHRLRASKNTADAQDVYEHLLAQVDGSGDTADIIEQCTKARKALIEVYETLKMEDKQIPLYEQLLRLPPEHLNSKSRKWLVREFNYRHPKIVRWIKQWWLNR